MINWFPNRFMILSYPYFREARSAGRWSGRLWWTGSLSVRSTSRQNIGRQKGEEITWKNCLLCVIHANYLHFWFCTYIYMYVDEFSIIASRGKAILSLAVRYKKYRFLTEICKSLNFSNKHPPAKKVFLKKINLYSDVCAL